MYNDGFTTDYEGWREFIKRKFHSENILLNDAIKSIGKFCFCPNFKYCNKNFTVKTHIYETEEELYESLSDFEVIYVVYQANMKRLGNCEPYLVRGIRKAEFNMVNGCRDSTVDISDVPELLDMTLKFSRRCAYDLSHAVGYIKDKKEAELFEERARYWVKLFQSGNSMKDYRVKITFENEKLYDENIELRKLIRELIDRPNDQELIKKAKIFSDEETPF